MSSELAGFLARDLRDKGVRARLLEALGRSGVGLAVTDAADRITAVNEAYAQVFGMAQEQMLGKTWRDLAPPERLAAIERDWGGCVERGETLRLEVARRRDGALRHFEINAVPFHGRKGRYEGHVCIARDVTERVQAAGRLKESEERFRELVEHCRDIIWSADEQGRLTYLNPAVERIVGIPPSEAIGRLYSEFLAPGQEEKAARLFVQVLAGRELMPPYELAFRKPTGEKVTLSICAKAVLSPEGRPLGARGTARDVTYRKQAEARLTLYRNIIAHCSEAIGILDLAGRYVEQNEAHRALLGYPDEELLGQTPAAHFGEDVFARMQRELESKGRFRGQLKGRHRSGEWRDIDLSVFLVRDTQNEPVCYVGLKCDVTERVRAEEELARHRLHLEEMVEERTSQLREANARLEREVAERKQAEQASAQERDNLLHILDSMGDGVCIINQQYEIQYVNPAIQRDFGPVEGRKCYEYFHGRQEVCPGCRNPEVFEGKTVRWEWYSARSGKTYDLLDTPFRNPDGSISKLELFRDVTGRKQAEEALRESEARLAEDNRALSKLHEISQRLVTEGDYPALLQAVVDAAISLTGADKGSLQFHDPASQTLRIASHRGFDQPFLKHFAVVDHASAVCGAAMECGQRVIVEDVAQSPIFLGTPSMAVMEAAGVRAVQSTPLWARDGSLLGVVSTHWSHPHRPDERTLRLVDLLARQAADLIERRQAEEALRESEARLKLAQSAADIGTWDWDIEANRATCSERYFELYGLPPDSRMPSVEDWLESVHPEDRERVIQEVQQALEGTSPYSTEYRVVWPDGSAHWLSSRGMVIRDKAGRLRRMIGANIDITERKEAEERLAESEARYHSLFANNHAVMLLIEPGTGRIVDANPAAGRFYGYSREELTARRIQDINTLSEQEVLAEMERAKTAQRNYFLFRHRLAGGQVRDVEVFSGPIQVRGRELLYSIVHDVTERVRAEEALRVKDAAIASSISAVAMADLEGRLTYVNGSFLNLWGYERQEEVLGRDVTEFWRFEEEARQVIRALQERGSWVGELVASRQDGSTFNAQLAASMTTDEAGEPICMMGSFVDVTERVRVEEALRRSEERYALAQRAAEIGSWDWDIVTGALKWSDAIEPMFGFAPGGFKGTYEAFLDCVHPEDRRLVVESVEACIEKDEDYDIEHRIVWPEGTVRWVSETGDVIRDERGRAVRMLGVVQDITERKQTEQTLRESEEQFRALVESTPDWVWEVDLEGRYTYASPRVQDILGYEPKEVLGGAFADLLASPEEMDRVRRLFGEVVERQGRLVALENVCRHRDGRLVVLETSAVPVFDAAGRLKGYRGIDRDVTERVRAEKALRESEERFRLAFEDAAVGMALVAQDGHMLRVNPTLCRLTGYSKEELEATDFQTITHPDDVEADVRQTERLWAGEIDSYEMDKRYIHKLGYPVWAHLSVALVRDGEGRPLYFLPQVQDITERKRAEEALREERNFSAALLDTVGALVVVLDREGRIVRFNQACERVTGYAFGEVEGRPFGEFLLTPEEAEPVMEVFSKLRAGQIPLDYENYWVTRDGGLRRIAWSNTVLKDEAGEVSYLIGTGLDITERKQAEEALAADTRLMEALFEGSHNPLVYLDRDFNFVRVNEAYAQSCNRTKAELLGRNHFEFFPHEANEAIFARVRDTGEPYMALARPFVFPDHPEWGETYWDWRLTPVKDGAGQVEGLVFSLVDVTERVRRLQELELARQRIEELARREEERASWLATILDQLPIGVTIAQAPDGRLVFTNSAAAKIWGREPASIPMEKYHEAWTFLDAEGRLIPGRQLPLARTVRDGASFINEEITLVREDGAQVPLMFNAVPLFEEGRITGGVVVFWDVTAQKEAQRRMEEASRLKDEFLSLASHELKTPVTSIKIYADLATRRPDMMRERFPQLMATLGRQADQLVSLVNDLLDVSRLQLGRMPLNLQRLDLSELVHEVCQRSRPTFEGRPLSCPPSAEPLLVEADPLRLEQVIHNLLDNAVKYSTEGTAIEVRLARREGTVLIEVSDQGIGITPETMPHIFERFFKPRTQQAVFGGLGLGLYICKEIVERHGGRIWATSVPNEGSTFYVELPLAGEG